MEKYTLNDIAWDDSRPALFATSTSEAARDSSEYLLDQHGVTEVLRAFGVPIETPLHIIGTLTTERGQSIKEVYEGTAFYRIPLLEELPELPEEFLNQAIPDKWQKFSELNHRVIDELGKIAKCYPQEEEKIPSPKIANWVTDLGCIALIGTSYNSIMHNQTLDYGLIPNALLAGTMTYGLVMGAKRQREKNQESANRKAARIDSLKQTELHRKSTELAARIHVITPRA